MFTLAYLSFKNLNQLITSKEIESVGTYLSTKTARDFFFWDLAKGSHNWNLNLILIYSTRMYNLDVKNHRVGGRKIAG